jgi:hypothetical protein
MNLNINFFDSSSSSSSSNQNQASNTIMMMASSNQQQQPPNYEDKYYSIIEEENKQKLKLQLEQEKQRLKSLMPTITFNLAKTAQNKDEYESNQITSPLSKTNNNNNPIVNIQIIPATPCYQQQQQHQQQYYHHPTNLSNSNNYSNKAFDDVVFDILKVDPDYIAGQLTLIDAPLFKAIEPDELISCKWMSREKLVKAPNIVHFTRRFNQTTFWAQKEILTCKRIEKRGKMITFFIKMAKRLNELHSFNCLMAIVVALKSAPIFRLKKTWSQHVTKRDASQFERLADLMFDTADNKRKMRDMHMSSRLPCIPFLGLFLTDLIHIDIAHPHNSFDNPQRRNQMNNICRLISEYQQSNYQDLTNISCSCTFTSNHEVTTIDNNNDSPDSGEKQQQQPESVCLVNNCNCGIHHGDGYGAGIINSDGTIYISEIGYVQNYLNSFLYIEELQKFKEDENYRDSLELEPDAAATTTMTTATPTTAPPLLDHQDSSPNKLFTKEMSDSMITTNFKMNPNPNSNNNANVNLNSQILHLSRFHNGLNSSSGKVNGLTSYNSVDNTNNSNNSLVLNYYHRKSLSLNNSNLVNETKEFLNELRHHPLDDSIVESTSNLPVLTTVIAAAAAASNVNTINGASNTLNNESTANNNNNTTTSSSSSSNNTNTSTANTTTTTNTTNNNEFNVCLNLNLTKEQQKQILNSVKLNDPPSLLKELLKHRHTSIPSSNNNNNNNNNDTTTTNKPHRKSSIHQKSKFNCYSGGGGNATSSDCDDDDNNDNNDESSRDQDVNNNFNQTTSTPSSSATPALSKIKFSSESESADNNTMQQQQQQHQMTTTNDDTNRRISGRNLTKILNESSSNTANRSAANNLTSSSISNNNNNNNNNNLDTNNDMTASHLILNNMLLLQQQTTSLIQFESPIRRKCIIKSFRKPRFSHWKSYWLQLVGGNLLIYYPAKTIVFASSSSSSTKTIEGSASSILPMGSARRNSTNSNEYYTDSVSSAITTAAAAASTHSDTIQLDEHSIIDADLKQQQTHQLQMQLQARKCNYHKNPCKMHPIASWMIVNLYQDKENEMMAASSSTSSSSSSGGNQKFDIQLNDLNNGNMYKYRLDSLPLAKEWFEQFKSASNYHERQKPDNLIRFD